jgi:DNA repair protein RecN (Recombination protein N)
VRSGPRRAPAHALGSASAELRAAGEVDPAAGELAARAFELSAAATELAVEVRSYRERLELDPARLQEVRERIGELDALQRKYGTGEAEVLVFLDRARESLEALAGFELELERAAAAVAERTERVAALATAVSDRRDTAAPELTRALRGSSASSGWRGPRSR